MADIDPEVLNAAREVVADISRPTDPAIFCRALLAAHERIGELERENASLTLERHDASVKNEMRRTVNYIAAAIRARGTT